MKLIMNSETAGRRIVDVSPNGSLDIHIVGGCLNTSFGLKTSRIVKATAGYADVVFETVSGSKYMLSFTDDDLYSPIIDEMFALAVSKKEFAPILRSPFTTRFAETFEHAEGNYA